jgi:hypothetical protein
MNLNSDIMIWIILFGVVIIIIGLYMSESTPLVIDEKKKILEINNIVENFAPNVEKFEENSNSTDVSEGASPKYHWGLPPDKRTYAPPPPPQCEEHPDKPCNCPPPPPPPKPQPPSCIPPPPYSPINDNQICRTCDITLNKDIDKYVLKSSVPPCPDMSQFATKNMINSCPDMSNYILKSRIPKCDRVDLSEYVRKSEIPAFPDCPICPECPICPICPEPPKQEQCKQLFEYNISDHPDMNDYIKKSDILNSDEVKKYINDNYVEKGKCNQTPCPVVHQEEREQRQEQRQEQRHERRQEIRQQINNILEEEHNIRPQMINNNNGSELLKNLDGYYAGDSLFAAV